MPLPRARMLLAWVVVGALLVYLAYHQNAPGRESVLARPDLAIPPGMRAVAVSVNGPEIPAVGIRVDMLSICTPVGAQPITTTILADVLITATEGHLDRDGAPKNTVTLTFSPEDAQGLASAQQECKIRLTPHDPHNEIQRKYYDVPKDDVDRPRV